MNTEFIEPAWHEVDVNLVFDDRGECCQHGLEPFYAAEKIIRESEGSKRARCRVGEFSVSLKRLLSRLWHRSAEPPLIGSRHHSRVPHRVGSGR